jgi:hypothetical protein
MRPKGTVVYRTPEQPDVKALEQEQRQDREERRVAAIERRENRVLLNKHTYASLYEEYQARVAAGGTRKLPHCKRCDATLQWEEPAHVCPGFTPKYVEHDEEWHERREARRQAIREAKWERLQETREERWEARREMIREAKLNGTFYDENESGDYCEGEDDDDWDCYDDPFECEDDGDPMWE